VIPSVKDRYQRMVAHVKYVGVDASVEQVNRCMVWVYRRYAKDHDLYVLEHGESRQTGTMGRLFSYSTLAVAEK
jgi:endonuclease YncB( thermonuclease family)